MEGDPLHDGKETSPFDSSGNRGSKPRRSKNYDFCVFEPRKLPKTGLPSTESVMACYQYIERKLRAAPPKNKDPSSKLIARKVAEKVQLLWNKAGRSTINMVKIADKIIRIHKKCQALKKSLKYNSTKRKIDELRIKGKALFDVSCGCLPTKKCPGCARKAKEEQLKSGNTEMNNDDTELPSDESTSDEDNGMKEEDEWTPNRPIICTTSATSNAPSTPHLTAKRNMVDVTTIATMSDRFRVSNTQAAAIATATLQCYGIIGTKNENAVDRSKIQRSRQKVRMQQHSQDIESCQSNPPKSLYFDGRKDVTLRFLRPGSKSHVYRTEEHISMVELPSERLLGIATPTSGHGKAIAEALFQKLSAITDMSALRVIGSDGTVVNTGLRNGAIRNFEILLGKSLQWVICLLHTNELPLRHLFEKLDGGTSGPKAFNGPIGKSLPSCVSLPIIKFKAIPHGDLPGFSRTELKDLSKDQLYLYQMVHAVGSGLCSKDLSEREPGNLNHARWLTTANRILRTYVGTPEPQEELKIIVLFIQKAYAPSWFKIKKNHRLIDGAPNFFYMLEKTRILPEKYKEIVRRVLTMNSYFAHPENVLVAMLVDTRQKVRQQAIERILHARNSAKTDDCASKTVRLFKVPVLNFDADEYINLINWDSVTITSPPVLDDFSDDQIREFYNSPAPIIEEYPCHTQAVERLVKMTTEASNLVIGEEARENHVRVTMKSRKMMPQFLSKNEYNATDEVAAMKSKIKTKGNCTYNA